MTTPRADGYRFPAEWEPHAATWIAWPHNIDTWPNRFKPIPARFAELIRTIARHEPVCVLVQDAIMRGRAQALLQDLTSVSFCEIRTNDAWIRDYGPMFVTGPGATLRMIDWRFNSWGGKYPPFDQDNSVPRRIASQLRVERYTMDLVLEGGAIDHNGRGTLLASTKSLLGPDRNPDLDLDQISNIIREFCRVDDVHWIDGDLLGDDTNGHIDQLVRFLDPMTIAFATESDARDANYDSLQRVERQVRAIRLRDGSRPTLVALPMPKPVFVDRNRLPASYLNFYFINDGIVVPQFDQPTDQVILQTLSNCLPGRNIVPFPSRELVVGLGGVHCLTQQQPRADNDGAVPLPAGA